MGLRESKALDVPHNFDEKERCDQYGTYVQRCLQRLQGHYGDQDIQALKLCNMSLGVEGARAVYLNMLLNSSVTELDLTGNAFGVDGVRYLAELMSISHSVLDVNLSHNVLGDEGAAAFAEKLPHSRLKKVKLSQNCIGELGAHAMSLGVQFNKTLTHLDLTSNFLGRGRGCTHLSDGIMYSTTLTTLVLEDNELDDADIRRLAPGLKTNATLTSLNLAQNHLTSNGARTLFGALIKRNGRSNIRLLDLAYNELGPIGARVLGLHIPAFRELRTLTLRANRIGDQGAKRLVEALCVLSDKMKMRCLDLSNNNIGPQGMIDLSSVVEEAPYITALDFSFNEIGEMGGDAMLAMTSNPRVLTCRMKHTCMPGSYATQVKERLKERRKKQKARAHAVDSDSGSDCADLEETEQRAMEKADLMVLQHDASFITGQRQPRNSLRRASYRLGGIDADDQTPFRRVDSLTGVVQSASPAVPLLGRRGSMTSQGSAVGSGVPNVVAPKRRASRFDASQFQSWRELAKEVQFDTTLYHPVEDARTRRRFEDPELPLNTGVIDEELVRKLIICVQQDDRKTQRLSLPGRKLGANPASRELLIELGIVLTYNVTVVEVDLACNALGFLGTFRLSQALAPNTSVRELNLSGNDIGPKGCAALAPLLTTNTTLRVLRLDNNNIGDQGFQCLTAFLCVETGSSLLQLDLQWNGLTKNSGPFLNLLMLRNRKLEVLNLCGNHIGNNGVLDFCEHAHTGLELNHTLRRLDLSLNFLGDKSGYHLLQRTTRSTSLRQVIVDGNMLCSALSNAFYSFNQRALQPRGRINSPCARYAPTSEPTFSEPAPRAALTDMFARAFGSDGVVTPEVDGGLLVPVAVQEEATSSGSAVAMTVSRETLASPQEDTEEPTAFPVPKSPPTAPHVIEAPAMGSPPQDDVAADAAPPPPDGRSVSSASDSLLDPPTNIDAADLGTPAPPEGAPPTPVDETAAAAAAPAPDAAAVRDVASPPDAPLPPSGAPAAAATPARADRASSTGSPIEISPPTPALPAPANVPQGDARTQAAAPPPHELPEPETPAAAAPTDVDDTAPPASPSPPGEEKEDGATSGAETPPSKEVSDTEERSGAAVEVSEGQGDVKQKQEGEKVEEEEEGKYGYRAGLDPRWDKRYKDEPEPGQEHLRTPPRSPAGADAAADVTPTPAAAEEAAARVEVAEPPAEPRSPTSPVRQDPLAFGGDDDDDDDDNVANDADAQVPPAPVVLAEAAPASPRRVVPVELGAFQGFGAAGGVEDGSEDGSAASDGDGDGDGGMGAEPSGLAAALFNEEDYAEMEDDDDAPRSPRRATVTYGFKGPEKYTAVPGKLGSQRVETFDIPEDAAAEQEQDAPPSARSGDGGDGAGMAARGQRSVSFSAETLDTTQQQQQQQQQQQRQRGSVIVNVAPSAPSGVEDTAGAVPPVDALAEAAADRPSTKDAESVDDSQPGTPVQRPGSRASASGRRVSRTSTVSCELLTPGVNSPIMSQGTVDLTPGVAMQGSLAKKHSIGTGWNSPEGGAEGDSQQNMTPPPPAARRLESRESTPRPMSTGRPETAASAASGGGFTRLADPATRSTAGTGSTRPHTAVVPEDGALPVDDIDGRRYSAGAIPVVSDLAGHDGVTGDRPSPRGRGSISPRPLVVSPPAAPAPLPPKEMSIVMEDADDFDDGDDDDDNAPNPLTAMLAMEDAAAGDPPRP